MPLYPHSYIPSLTPGLKGGDPASKDIPRDRKGTWQEREGHGVGGWEGDMTGGESQSKREGDTDRQTDRHEKGNEREVDEERI